MSRLLVAMVLWVLWFIPALGQDADYLNDQARFDQAWAELVGLLPYPDDLYDVRITPDRIDVIARASGGGARIDAWAAGRRGEDDIFAGPAATEPSGPIGDVEAGMFRRTDVSFDRLVTIAEEILPYAKFADPGRVREVTIARHVALIPRPGFADVRWRIEAGSARESATVQASADGVLFGLDISNTMRGRTRNFREQADWPFDEAQKGFADLIGPETDVYAVEVLRESIAVVADSGDGNETRISWDGGRYTRGLVDTPRFDFEKMGIAGVRGVQNRPFRLDELSLAAIPQVLATAREALEGREQTLISMRAVFEEDAPNAMGLHWLLTFGTEGRAVIRDSDEDTVIRVLPDGTLAHVRLPASIRPTYNFLDTHMMIWARDSWLQGLKGETPVLEIVFEPDTVDVIGMSGDNPGNRQWLHLNDQGFKIGGEFPVIFEGPANLFRLDAMKALNSETLDKIKAEALAAVGIEGAEVFRIKMWSGGPFYPLTPDAPLFDVRVGIPPEYRRSGYAVFRTDGTLVEAFN